MNGKNTLCFILNAGLPFVRETGSRFASQELPFFEMISLNFLPFLEMLERLDAENIPFRVALAISPLLCCVLTDDIMIKRYLEYLDNQISFGKKEIERTENQKEFNKLAIYYYEAALKNKTVFTERYKCDILKEIYSYVRKGKIELLTGSAVQAYLPFFANHPKAINAFIETGINSHKKFFKTASQGFWLPNLAYSEKLDTALLSRGAGWTVIDTHGALLGNPPSRCGSFAPVKTKNGLLMLIRDFYAYKDIVGDESKLTAAPFYLSYFDDVVYELPLKEVMNFLSITGSRIPTGYRYYSRTHISGKKEIYKPFIAEREAKKKARLFLKKRSESLKKAENFSGMNTVSVCTLNIDFLGRFWKEGWIFLEEIFRESAREKKKRRGLASIQIENPSKYLYSGDINSFQTITPEYSSQGFHGYGEGFLDSSNDWIYKQLLRALDRMINLAGQRRETSSGIWERVLSQAAREIMLASDSTWAEMLSGLNRDEPKEWRNYAENCIKSHLRNFTTFYEALGSCYISTRFLIDLEKKDNIFPEINYKTFTR